MKFSVIFPHTMRFGAPQQVPEVFKLSLSLRKDFLECLLFTFDRYWEVSLGTVPVQGTTSSDTCTVGFPSTAHNDRLMACAKLSWITRAHTLEHIHLSVRITNTVFIKINVSVIVKWFITCNIKLIKGFRLLRNVFIEIEFHVYYILSNIIEIKNCS